MSELLERILGYDNIKEAYHHVESRKGAGGVDGMDPGALKE